MGFDVALVESEERHYDAFVCAICQNLVDLDCLVTTTCSHCFCKSCLTTWLEQELDEDMDDNPRSPSRRTCPTCNRDLLYANTPTTTTKSSASASASTSTSTKTTPHSNHYHSYPHQSMMIGKHTVLVRPLKDSQPLAHRLLKSVLVRCPLRTTVACPWKGDYGDLESHLLSKTAHSNRNGTLGEAQRVCTRATGDGRGEQKNQDELEQEQNHRDNHREQLISLASSLKEEANGKFRSGHFREAESLYSKAIEVVPEAPPGDSPPSPCPENLLLATLYSNRAAAYLRLQQFARCLEDCETVIHRRLDARNAKVYVRAARANLQLGRLRNAEKVLSDGKRALGGGGGENNHHHPVLVEESRQIRGLLELESRGHRELASQRFADAKGTFGSVLKSAPSAAPFLLGAARADLGLGRTDAALGLTKKVLVDNPQNPQGYWVRGQAVFLMGDDPGVAIQLLQEALRLDPDEQSYKQTYKQAKKVQTATAEAQKCIFVRKFEEAIGHLSVSIETLRPLPSKAALYAKLYTQRAECYLRLKRYGLAMKDCALVVYAQEYHVPAWLVRFEAHHGLGQHAPALEQATDLLRRWPHDPKLRRAYERADFLVRKGKRVDFYGLLGVPSVSSEMEIKKAYKKRALELHPDKLPRGSTAREQREARERFQQLGDALEILCDDFRRKLYDEGYDPEAIRERAEAAQRAARDPHGGRYPHGHR